MADSTIPDLPDFVGNPSGSEFLETVQGGASVKIPQQKVADLATIVTPVTLVGMAALISGSQVVSYRLYIITNSTQGRILVKGLTTTTLESGALNLTTGASGIYVFGTDTFTPSGGESWSSTLVSSNTTASNNTQYIVNASATFTDPSPIEGKGFLVYVRNGTATIGGTAYATAGSIIWRVFHSGAWVNYYQSPFNDATSSIQTQFNALAQTVPIASCSNGTAVTGTLLNTFSKALPIPLNSRTANQAPQVDVNVEKTGTAGNINVRLYWNTTPDIAGSPILLGIMTAGATTRVQPMSRILAIEVANGTGNGTKVVPTGVASLTQWASFTSPMTTTAIDWTAAGYLVVAMSNGNAGDSSVCNMIKLH